MENEGTAGALEIFADFGTLILALPL